MDISSVFDRQVIFDKFVKTKSKIRLDDRYNKLVIDKNSKYYIDIAINNRDNRINFRYLMYIFKIFIAIGVSILITKTLYSKYIPDSWLVSNFYDIIIVLSVVFVVIVVLVIFSVQSDKNIIASLISLVVVLTDEGILADKEYRVKTISYLYKNIDSVGGLFIKIKNFTINSNVLKKYNFIPPFFIGILTTYFSGVLKLEESITIDDMFKILSLIFSLFVTMSLLYLLFFILLYIFIKNEVWNDELYKMSLENLIFICTLKESDEIISYLYNLGARDVKGEENITMRNFSDFDKYNVQILKKELWSKLGDTSQYPRIKLLIVADLIFSCLYFNCEQLRINLTLFLLYLSSLFAVIYIKYNSNTKISNELLEIVRSEDGEGINNLFKSLNEIYNKTYIFKVSLLTILLVLIIPKRIIFNEFSNVNSSIIDNIITLVKSSILVVVAVFIIYELINSIKINYLMNLKASSNEKDN